jgi:hypothetical protein
MQTEKHTFDGVHPPFVSIHSVPRGQSAVVLQAINGLGQPRLVPLMSIHAASPSVLGKRQLLCVHVNGQFSIPALQSKVQVRLDRQTPPTVAQRLVQLTVSPQLLRTVPHFSVPQAVSSVWQQLVPLLLQVVPLGQEPHDTVPPQPSDTDPHVRAPQA